MIFCTFAQHMAYANNESLKLLFECFPYSCYRTVECESLTTVGQQIFCSTTVYANARFVVNLCII